MKPFVVAIFCGTGKPNVATYLQEFVAEMQLLMVHGMEHNGKVYTVKLIILCVTTQLNATLNNQRDIPGIKVSLP